MNHIDHRLTKLFSVALLAVVVASCSYSPHPANGEQSCATSGGKVCPSGYYCASDGSCWIGGTGPNVGGAGGTAGAAGTGGAHGGAGGSPLSGGGGSIGSGGHGGSAGGTGSGGAVSTGGIGGSRAPGGAPGTAGSTGTGGVIVTGTGGTVATGTGGAGGVGGAGGGTGGAAGSGASHGSCGCSLPLVCYRPSFDCEDPNWAEWPMPNGSVDVGAGAPNLDGYSDNQDGTVTDNVTNLMWQQTVYTTMYTWAEAVSYCQTLSLANYSDWRLPSTIELVSLVDYSIATPGPAINTTYFPGAFPGGGFWSSTPTVGSAPAESWVVSFNDGTTVTEEVTTSNVYARCVR
jgi:hypothetical protein